MKRLMATALAATIIIPILSFSANAGGKVIYGDDDRMDYNAMPSAMKTLSDSVVSLWESGNVTLDASGNFFKLKTRKFGDAVGLCKTEKFREQPIGAFCSGSLVGEDMIMTAGHCVTSETKCKGTKFVFGFAVGKNGKVSTKIKKGDVYSCAKIVARFLGKKPAEGAATTGLGADYALVKLDRKVAGRKPLAVNRKNTGLENGTSMFVIGHPVGLPVKLAGGASVRDASPKGYFVANLDTYGGNSGSPVFNAATKLIEGILVRGETDFKYTDDGCRVSNVVPNTGGRGEDVTKVSVLASHIPSLKAEKTAQDAMMNANAIREVNFEDIEALSGVLNEFTANPFR